MLRNNIKYRLALAILRATWLTDPYACICVLFTVLSFATLIFQIIDTSHGMMTIEGVVYRA